MVELFPFTFVPGLVHILLSVKHYLNPSSISRISAKYCLQALAQNFIPYSTLTIIDSHN